MQYDGNAIYKLRSDVSIFGQGENSHPAPREKRIISQSSLTNQGGGFRNGSYSDFEGLGGSVSFKKEVRSVSFFFRCDGLFFLMRR